MFGGKMIVFSGGKVRKYRMISGVLLLCAKGAPTGR
jgi:hypothetical protein